MATKDLWDKFRAAQKEKNTDAAYAFKNAIECANKGKEVDAAWWEHQGNVAIGIAEPVKV